MVPPIVPLYRGPALQDIYNEELYGLVTPASIMSWQRVLVANLMADSGPQWAALAAFHNSGTCACVGEAPGSRPVCSPTEAHCCVLCAVACTDGPVRLRPSSRVVPYMTVPQARTTTSTWWLT